MSEKDWWSRWFRDRESQLFGGGLMNIDRLFKEMEETMKNEFEELSKLAPKELVRERTLPDGSKVKQWGPFIYGQSVTIGSDGRPQMREFGNIKPVTRTGRPQVNIKEQREPLVDVLETNGEVRVIAELPGVEKRDIKLHGNEDTLTISVDSPQRRYYKEVRMPVKVKPKQAKSTYKNGVLEITVNKQKKEKPKGESIEIE